jgi:hypothetical protein
MSKDETDSFIFKSLEKSEDGNTIYHLNSKEKTRFQLNISAIETLVEEDNKGRVKVRGIASSTSVDHYGTEMSFKALMKMKEQVKEGVVILPRHDSLAGSGLAEWDEVIGRTVDAEVKQAKVKNPSRLNRPQFVLEVDSYLYSDDQRTVDLIKRLKRGEPIGQSIGGWFENIQVEETDDGEIKRVIVQDVTLDHIAITRAPANPDSGGLSLNIRSSIKSYLSDRRETMPKRTTKKSNTKEQVMENDSLTVTETPTVEVEETRAEIADSAVEVAPVSEEIKPTGDAIADQNQVPFEPLEAEMERMKEEMSSMKEEMERIKYEEKMKLLMKEKEEMSKEMERMKAELEKMKLRDLEDEDREEKEDHEGGALKDDQDHIEALIQDQEEDAEDLSEDQEIVMYEKTMKEKEELMKEIERMKYEMAEKMKEQRTVVPFNSNLPLATETLSWDWNTLSQNEILGDSGDNWELYKKAHLYFDENKNMETKSAYKLPIAKIVDGDLKVVFRALVAAVGSLNGARGGVEVPSDERSKIYENIKKYYAKFNKEVPELVNLSKELQETEIALDNTNNLSNSSINNTNSNRSEDMNKEDMQGIIAEVTKSVLEAMNSERQERSVPEATNTVNTRSVQGNDIIDIAHGTKEPTIEELKARLEQAEHTLSRVLAQPLRKGRHTTTSVRGIGAEVEMDHLIEVSASEGHSSLATVMRRNKEILMRNAESVDTKKVSSHQLKDVLKQGLRAAFLDGLIGTPVDGWQ